MRYTPLANLRELSAIITKRLTNNIHSMDETTKTGAPNHEGADKVVPETPETDKKGTEKDESAV